MHITHFALLACTLSSLAAQQPTLPCDRTAIRWVLPGNFPAALERAQNEQRILIIKGISFGVDEVGATCATKGVW